MFFKKTINEVKDQVTEVLDNTNTVIINTNTAINGVNKKLQQISGVLTVSTVLIFGVAAVTLAVGVKTLKVLSKVKI